MELTPPKPFLLIGFCHICCFCNLIRLFSEEGPMQVWQALTVTPDQGPQVRGNNGN